MPPSIEHLKELVQLSLSREVPDGIGKLVFLEKLEILNVSIDKPKEFLKELGNLRELRVLIMWCPNGMDKSMERDFVDSLSHLQKLHYIDVDGLSWSVDTTMWEAAGFMLPPPLHYLRWFIEFSKLPSCMNPSRLPNLSHLVLQVTTMDEEDLKLLARLPALCYLYLETASTVTASNINANDVCFFQKLWYFLTNRVVLFEQPNQEDASVSLHMWNGEDAMPFASRKSNDSTKVVTSGVMPNLEVLWFKVPLQALKDNNGDCGNIGLEYLPSLRELRGRIDCHGAPATERDAAFAALRNACNLHPNRPTFDML